MYRDRLPQVEGGLFITDGGIETTLIYHRGLELPAFAAFDLLKDDAGTEELRRYYVPYALLAREHGVGLVLESPTWRANPDWAAEIGYSLDELDAFNRKAIALMEELREEYAGRAPIVISGCVGPQSDGYSPETILSAAEAEAYHSTQIGTFADTAADMVTAITMTYADEAIGVARAAAKAGLPSAISFTVETDGRLPNGQGARRSDRAGRPRDGLGAGLLHDQLRAPQPLRRRARGRRALGAPDRRSAHQRVDQEPCGAGRGNGARRGRPDRSRGAPRRAEGSPPGRERPRRVLRHRRPPCRRRSAPHGAPNARR